MPFQRSPRRRTRSWSFECQSAALASAALQLEFRLNRAMTGPSIMITTSNSPVKGERDARSITRCSPTQPSPVPGLSRVHTELVQLLAGVKLNSWRIVNLLESAGLVKVRRVRVPSSPRFFSAVFNQVLKKHGTQARYTLSSTSPCHHDCCLPVRIKQPPSWHFASLN